MAEQSKGICFVIAPIGEEGSDTRTRSDKVFNHVIKPVAEECGYTPMRADQSAKPGMITHEIINHLLEDPMVIADLTGPNANVFYELAVRHAAKMPVVQMIAAGERIPFDVAGLRTIPLDHTDLDSVARCKQDMAEQMRSSAADSGALATPLSMAVDLKLLESSRNPLEASVSEIVSALQSLRADMESMAEVMSALPYQLWKNRFFGGRLGQPQWGERPPSSVDFDEVVRSILEQGIVRPPTTEEPPDASTPAPPTTDSGPTDSYPTPPPASRDSPPGRVHPPPPPSAQAAAPSRPRRAA